MSRQTSQRIWSLAKLLAALLVVRVTVAVLVGYRDYFPPNFQTDFLLGRSEYFFRDYQWAFYAHIAAGPPALIVGLLLISKRFRARYPKWHRYLGRIQGANVLVVLLPSGWWMALYARGGRIAEVGFGVLTVLTATCVILGWRAAVKKRFAHHERWMWRTFVLLCSAVVIRILGGAATVFRIDYLWFDGVATWVSWVVPLTIFELSTLRARRLQRH